MARHLTLCSPRKIGTLKFWNSYVKEQKEETGEIHFNKTCILYFLFHMQFGLAKFHVFTGHVASGGRRGPGAFSSEARSVKDRFQNGFVIQRETQ